MSDTPQIRRPIPRRPFELPSASSSQPSTPTGETQSGEAIDFLDVKNDLAAKRSGSLLNLTSSTLFGIFQPTAFEDSRTDDSPWDTQVHTPIEPRVESLVSQLSQQQQRELSNGARASFSDGQGKKHVHRIGRTSYVPLALKISLLFACGVVYGIIMAHLHENNWITPVRLEYIDRNSYTYLTVWGIAAVAFAFVLPWFDNLWDSITTDQNKSVSGKKQDSNSRTSRWTLAIRSVGAFVGIGFALRRLPWESTTQESLTLALVNPLLWYLIDRTQTGFWLSTVIALVGMGITLGLHPELIASSSTVGLGIRNWRLEYDVEGGLTQDAAVIAIWLASVFYSACVCFGNIGRHLTVNDNNQRMDFSSTQRK